MSFGHAFGSCCPLLSLSVRLCPGLCMESLAFVCSYPPWCGSLSRASLGTSTCLTALWVCSALVPKNILVVEVSGITNQVLPLKYPLFPSENRWCWHACLWHTSPRNVAYLQCPTRNVYYFMPADHFPWHAFRFRNNDDCKRNLYNGCKSCLGSVLGGFSWGLGRFHALVAVEHLTLAERLARHR